MSVTHTGEWRRKGQELTVILSSMASLLASSYRHILDLLPHSGGVVLNQKKTNQQFLSTETSQKFLCAPFLTSRAALSFRIACVSAPSVYQKLRELHREDISVYIFEYDRRFAIYRDEFIFYDYNHPLDLPEGIAAHSFDIVVADPPYLSEECLRKTSETIQFLTRGKVLLCTGAIMEEQAARLLRVKMCKFIPEHSRNLANEFRCYTNYDSGLD
ncbi:EEF1A lysine methyltransferase 1 [Grammomys surdaster]|uniref:EEF1A lysine methyltransferase 1 n=1 Tax=Grammomys surdaster TaxID=491861 RepID=UPI0010A062EB|nr:EEF1A lysine methyltransferase 1 [Grammomys surdaster]